MWVGRKTYDSFERNGLDETVEDLGEHAGTEARPAHFVRIPRHAFLPVVAHHLHSGNPAVSLAPVFVVFVGAAGHFCDYLRGFHDGALVDVVGDYREAFVYHEDQQTGEEAVENELQVDGECGGEAGVGVDKGENAAYGCHEAHRGDCWLLFLTRAFAAAWAFFRVGIVAQATRCVSHVFVCVSSAALLYPTVHYVRVCTTFRDFPSA